MSVLCLVEALRGLVTTVRHWSKALHGMDAVFGRRPAARSTQTRMLMSLLTLTSSVAPRLLSNPTRTYITTQVMKALVATDRLDQYAASAVGASSPGDLVCCEGP